MTYGDAAVSDAHAAKALKQFIGSEAPARSLFAGLGARLLKGAQRSSAGWQPPSIRYSTEVASPQ